MPQLSTPPNPSHWKGRYSPASGYWHQHVKLISMADLPKADGSPACVLLGYACDEGVKRNQGRPGAAQAPEAFWPQLAKLAWHLPAGTQVYVGGHISCEGDRLEKSQTLLAQTLSQIQELGYPTFVMGGGHEIAYGHGAGVRKAWEKAGKKWGILNLDAHFDLRKVEQRGNSGTPFYQLLSEGTFPYAVAGIQPLANPYSLFSYAKQWEVTWLEENDCQHPPRVENWLSDFLAPLDYVYLSLDMDVLNRAHAPGVSAPNPLGLSPHQVSSMIQQVVQSGKLRSMDIAECNPTYDQDEATMRLAARFAAQGIAGMVGE